jgi:hypothetical protein
LSTGTSDLRTGFLTLLLGMCLLLIFCFLALHAGPSQSRNVTAQAGRYRAARGREAVSGRERRPGPADFGSLPYLSGYRPAPEESGVTRYDPGRAFDGLNIFASGHGQEASIIDMKGGVVHSWSYDIRRLWPDAPREQPEMWSFWRRVLVLDDGSLLAIYEGIGIIKLDRNSNLIWSHRGGEHHDMALTENGDIYVLTRKVREAPELGPIYDLLDDCITLLDSEGRLVEEFSIYDAFMASRYKDIFRVLRQNMGKYKGDVFHTNTLKLLDGNPTGAPAAFRKGNIMISCRNNDCIAVIDPRGRKVVWALCGTSPRVLLWQAQHEPVLLASGNILLLDNTGNRGRYGASKVVEFDPGTLDVRWAYEGRENEEFSTPTCGTAERLPNGNTLITESDNGRAFEVTPDKEIVWEYLNPRRAGEDGELVATLFHLSRLTPDRLAWLN